MTDTTCYADDDDDLRESKLMLVLLLQEASGEELGIAREGVRVSDRRRPSKQEARHGSRDPQVNRSVHDSNRKAKQFIE